MSDPVRTQVTHLLGLVANGEAGALDRLIPLVYEELHQMARRHIRGEPANHTLQATALLHEAFLKLVDKPAPSFRDRRHFMAVASTAMRHILVDHARARAAEKHGGKMVRVPFDEAIAHYEKNGLDLLAVHEALEKLSAMNPALTEVVEMHFFGGMTIAEIAGLLGVTERAIYAKWSLARAWLRGQIGGSEQPGDRPTA